MVECETGQLTPAMETAIHREVMRCEMMVWLSREVAFAPRTAAEADAAAAEIEKKVLAVRQAIRLRDPSLALGPVAAAAASLGLPIVPAALPRIGRAVLGVLAELHEAELVVEGGATVEEATRALRQRHFGGRPPERLTPPVRLSAAVAKAIERASTLDMTDKVRTTGELMLAFFGADAFLDDVFTRAHMIAFLAWCTRLPNTHGKAHGRNKYEKVGHAGRQGGGDRRGRRQRRGGLGEDQREDGHHLARKAGARRPAVCAAPDRQHDREAPCAGAHHPRDRPRLSRLGRRALAVLPQGLARRRWRGHAKICQRMPGMRPSCSG
jgi:hypothetical protein